MGALRPPHPPPTQLGIDLCSTQPVQPHMVVCACHVPSHAHCATGHFSPVPIALPLGPSAPGFPLTWAWVWTPPSGHLERRDAQDTGSALGLVPLCPEDWTPPPASPPSACCKSIQGANSRGCKPHTLSAAPGDMLSPLIHQCWPHSKEGPCPSSLPGLCHHYCPWASRAQDQEANAMTPSPLSAFLWRHDQDHLGPQW